MNLDKFRRRGAATVGVVVGLGMLPVLGAQTASAADGELFFSEYVEGSSNNKALEIYNGTGAEVDLTGYQVQVSFNGGSSTGTFDLSGELAAGEVYVLAHSGADPVVTGVADQTTGAGLWNGDDAVSLLHDGATLDVIGQIGTDPGSQWGSGETSTADNTLRRKASVSAGDPDGSDPFDPALEWDGFPQDTFDGLGSHAAGPPADVPPSVVSTVPADGAVEVPGGDDLSVTFSEPVTAGDGAFSVSCSGADVAVTVSGGPSTFTLTPEQPLPAATDCTLTVHAAEVSDQDGDPDPMATDHVTAFGTAESGPVCERSYTPTYEIQGEGTAAAVTGPVSTKGVVVGDYEGPAPALRGFYLQDLEGDGDPRTSDAVFVFNGNEDEVAIGDVVRVTGEASEFQDQTQVSAHPDGVALCGSDETVKPTKVRLPFRDTADKERYEGMLVRFTQPLKVTEHFQLGRFGQVLLSGHTRLPQPTNVLRPGPLAQKLQQLNELNQILVDDATQDQNPDPIRFARDGEPLSASNTLRGGDTADKLVGVMTYTWGGNAASPNDYRIRPIGSMDGSVRFKAKNKRPSRPDRVGGDLRVASFNVLNYFNSFGNTCTGGVTGPPMECRGADDATELERQAAKVVAAIRGLDADVVGVVEIENDGYGPDSALQDLVDRLNAAEGAGTYAFVDVDAGTGQVDALGDDAIKVGMIYKPDAVTPVGQTAALNTPSFVTGGGDEPRNRPALAQSFEDEDGERVTVVVNHLKSKGSDCLPDDPDTEDGQGNCNQTRVNAAQELAQWLAADPTGVDDSDALVMGDLNSYAKEDPVVALEDAGFTDLVRRHEGISAYSYVFDGQWGYLDHALASASLKRQVTGVTTWHINADEPSVLDYNTDFKSASQVAELYAPDAYRSSDHDPVLVGLKLKTRGHGHGHGGGRGHGHGHGHGEGHHR